MSRSRASRRPCSGRRSPCAEPANSKQEDHGLNGYHGYNFVNLVLYRHARRLQSIQAVNARSSESLPEFAVAKTFVSIRRSKKRVSAEVVRRLGPKVEFAVGRRSDRSPIRLMLPEPFEIVAS
jgi:hypothetical protein